MKKQMFPFLALVFSLFMLIFASTTLAHNFVRTPRIAALEISLTDDLTALGIEPVCLTVSEDVGGVFNRLGPGYLLKTNPHLRQVPQVGSREHPNLESLLNCKPQLILADTARDSAIYSQLQQIAPTVMLNSLRINYPEMEQTFLAIAKAVGREAKGQRILAEQKKIIQHAKAKTLQNAGPMLVINLYPDNEIKAFTSNSYIAKLFTMLGRRYALPAQHGEFVQTTTLEGLLTINPDAIVVLLTDGNPQPLYQMQTSPLWQRLNAVKNQRIYIADRALWVQSPGILSSREIIQQAVDNGLLANQPSPVSKQSLPTSSQWF